MRIIILILVLISSMPLVEVSHVIDDNKGHGYCAL